MNTTSTRVATTIKVENGLYDQFKVLGISHRITLQGLVEKTIYKYVTDANYRKEIDSFLLPIATPVTSSVA